MSSITKKNLTSHVEVTCGLDKKKSEEVVDEMLELIARSLVKGHRVMLAGIGVLAGEVIAPRVVKGFGDEHRVGERVKVKFRIAKELSTTLEKKNKKSALDEMRKSFSKKL